MATKKSKTKKLNKKEIAKILIPITVAIIIIYVMHKVIDLIMTPTDVFMIEYGTIYNEESAIRLCDKR